MLIRALAVMALVLTSQVSPRTAAANSLFGYDVEIDVVYGQGRIAPDGVELLRDLKMDVYTPTTAGTGPWPAVVYIHGGAFHRGGRRNPVYKLGGAVHSSPEDWARLLAANGFKTFVLEYRLAPENPITAFVPGQDHTLTDLRSIISEDMMEGFSRGRGGIGLPPLGYSDADLDIIWDAYMSGVEDAELALSYIVEHAQELNIDPNNIGMGGHSAGGGITASVALGRDVPLKAAFPLSPPNTFFESDFIVGRQDLPAILMHFSQYDDEPVLRHASTLSEMLRSSGAEFTLGWIPGFMHFYPHNAPSLADDGTRISLGDRVLAFLTAQLKDQQK